MDSDNDADKGMTSVYDEDDDYDDNDEDEGNDDDDDHVNDEWR